MTKSPSHIAVAVAVAGLCLFGATGAAPPQNYASPGPQLLIDTLVKGRYERLAGSLVMFAEDDTIDLTCFIQGYALHSLSWWEDGMLLPGCFRGKDVFQSYIKVSLTGLSSRDDGRQLTCQADDMELARTVDLTMNATKLPTLHLNITTIVGGSFETLVGSEVMFEEDSNLQITCFIQGHTRHTLAWWEDGMLQDGISNRDDVHSFSKVSLTGLSSRDDGRQLTCEADDIELSRTLELRKKVPESSKPSSPPLHITIAVGGNYRRVQGNMVWFSENRNFKLTCFIQYQTSHSISWWEDGMLLDGINGTENYQSYSKLSLTGLPSKDDGRQLTCKADDMEISRSVELRRKVPGRVFDQPDRATAQQQTDTNLMEPHTIAPSTDGTAVPKAIPATAASLPPTTPATTTTLPPTTSDATTARTKPLVIVNAMILSISVALAAVI